MKKILCMLLVVLCAMGLLVGCSEETVEVPTLIPEKQILLDKYEASTEITDTMGYSLDYMTSQSTIFSDMDITMLFEHIRVQVDDWECVVVGKTTMGEIADIVDKANERYVTDNTNAIIAARQAIIDEEYEEAKRKAESNGKTYDKPKKEVRTDDIHFDEPYSYSVTLGDHSKAVSEEYKPTLLVDPQTYDVIFFDVAKYGIPYVRFEFHSTNYIYNTHITQECDWTMNCVQAASLSALIDEETGERPEYVDADGRNKAAKQNIRMSGNIAFGGDGFTWDSLMILCNALQLQQDHDRHGFEQSSDDFFTYYTIYLYTNPFEFDENVKQNETVYSPFTRLIATFDPLSQVCLNWTVDTYASQDSFNRRVHDLSEPIFVNVHEYQVDTNDYAGMRDNIKTWINENALPYGTYYCALNPNNRKLIGVLDTGLTNIGIEPVLDGEVYHCLGYEEKANGTIAGTYISDEEMQKANALETEDEKDSYIAAHCANWEVVCCILNDDKDIVGVFDGGRTVSNNGTVFHVAAFEETDGGFKNVRLLTEEQVGQLLMVYAKTYKLTEDQSSDIMDIFKTQGLITVSEYIDELFASAEEAQKEQQENMESTESGTESIPEDADSQSTSSDSNTTSQDETSEAPVETEDPTLAETVETNTEGALNELTFGDTKIDINTLTLDQVVDYGFVSEGTNLFIIGNEAVNIGGLTLVNADGIELKVASGNNVSVSAIVVNTQNFMFANGLCVGMTLEAATQAIANENVKMLNDEFLILKNTDNTLVLRVEEGTVTEIYLLVNELFFSET